MARPKHRTTQSGTYFVSTNTWQRRALFNVGPAAEAVEHKLFEYRDKGEYAVHSYVVMHEHFHAILTPGKHITLERAMQLIKGGSSRMIASRFPVWQAGFAEHRIRNEADYRRHVEYIHQNPVKAGYVTKPEEYAHSSASGERKLDAWPVASGAEAPERDALVAAGLKPRPSE